MTPISSCSWSLTSNSAAEKNGLQLKHGGVHSKGGKERVSESSFIFNYIWQLGSDQKKRGTPSPQQYIAEGFGSSSLFPPLFQTHPLRMSMFSHSTMLSLYACTQYQAKEQRHHQIKPKNYAQRIKRRPPVVKGITTLTFG